MPACASDWLTACLENFAEAIWAGKNPDPAAELPSWVEKYTARRYGANIPAAQEAWKLLVATFYQGTGEHGTSIRSWPPSTSTATPPAYRAPAAPQAMRLLLEAEPSVLASGRSGIEYDLVMLGFEWMQTLFEDYWTLAKATCDVSASPTRPGINATACEPCESPLKLTQQFVWDGAGGAIELMGGNGSLSGLCLDGGCTAAQCGSISLGDCKALGAAALFKPGQGSSSKLILSARGMALDYGVYCSGCKPSLGLAGANPAFSWERFDVNLSSVGTPSISVEPQTGGRCCLTAIGALLGTCADTIHAICPGLQGNDCITCVEKHAAGLSADCTDLNSQMHGVCGAVQYERHQAPHNAHGPSAGTTGASERSFFRWLPRTELSSACVAAACNATTGAVRALIDDLDRFVGTHPLWLLGAFSTDEVAVSRQPSSTNYITRLLRWNRQLDGLVAHRRCEQSGRR